MKHTKINHELGDLKARNPLFPRNTDSPCALEIVPVHNNMNKKVQGNWNP